MPTPGKCPPINARVLRLHKGSRLGSAGWTSRQDCGHPLDMPRRQGGGVAPPGLDRWPAWGSGSVRRILSVPGSDKSNWGCAEAPGASTCVYAALATVTFVACFRWLSKWYKPSPILHPLVPLCGAHVVPICTTVYQSKGLQVLGYRASGTDWYKVGQGAGTNWYSGTTPMGYRLYQCPKPARTPPRYQRKNKAPQATLDTDRDPCAESSTGSGAPGVAPTNGPVFPRVTATPTQSPCISLRDKPKRTYKCDCQVVFVCLSQF